MNNIPEMAPNFFQSSPQGIHQPYMDIVGTSSGGCGDGSVTNGGGEDTRLSSFLCSISMLKEKVNQVQSLATLFVSSGSCQGQPALTRLGTVIQEFIDTASSMMFNCNQIALGSLDSNSDNSNKNHSSNDIGNTNNHLQHQHMVTGDRLSQLSMVGGNDGNSNNSPCLYGESFYDWYTDNNFCHDNNSNYLSAKADSCKTTITNTTTNTFTLEWMPSQKQPRNDTTTSYNNNIDLSKEKPHRGLEYDIVELDAADLLAKYTHYCQVCGKGFRRDANLRMHMRAHGDEYKSVEALSNPLKQINNGYDKGDGSSSKPPRKYSCPQQGCRWNKNHAKFTPLKSMICVKNHYKRSHCPKLYVCKRCNSKQFSILSDLRTHEKHCGDLRWQCSCGTTFSRKDKLMGHVTLFQGHTPIIHPSYLD